MLDGIGFLTYVVYPAAPPWMVANANGVSIHRVVGQVWGQIGLATAAPLVKQGRAFDNQVAAVPSMHAATTMLILLFVWPRARSWVRAGLVAYVLAMAFVLIDGGEHYIFDIVAGWLYAAGVMFAFELVALARRRAGWLGAFRRKTARELPAAGLEPPPQPAGEPHGGLLLRAMPPALETEGEC